MFKLLTVFAVALVLAYFSQKNTKAVTSSGYVYKAYKDWAYVLLVVVLVLFAGLRTSYNDTHNYVGIYNQLPGLGGFLSDADNLNPLSNPLFYLFLNILKLFTSNAQVFIFLTSLFTQICFVKFIKRYSQNFVFGIFIYFTLGTFALTLAAIKQVVAMGVLTLAIPYLLKKKWVKYYLLVLVAMLIHTYALAFAILPLFIVRPWKLFTYVFASAMAFFMMNFQEIITAFLEQADEMGKNIAEYEVFDDTSVNVFRIAVYIVTPIISLVFQKWVFKGSTSANHVLVHMSIISLAFMIMGTQSGANMFGRMANYFELGTVCSLPWMLKQTFEKRSYKLVSILAVAGFMGFFIYANAIKISFDIEYQSVGILKFISSLFV